VVEVHKPARMGLAYFQHGLLGFPLPAGGALNELCLSGEAPIDRTGVAYYTFFMGMLLDSPRRSTSFGNPMYQSMKN